MDMRSFIRKKSEGGAGGRVTSLLEIHQIIPTMQSWLYFMCQSKLIYTARLKQPVDQSAVEVIEIYTVYKQSVNKQ